MQGIVSLLLQGILLSRERWISTRKGRQSKGCDIGDTLRQSKGGGRYSVKYWGNLVFFFFFSQGGTLRKIGWGCAARFSKPLPYL